MTTYLKPVRCHRCEPPVHCRECWAAVEELDLLRNPPPLPPKAPTKFPEPTLYEERHHDE